MVSFNFNPFGNRSLVLKFECDECKHGITSEEIEIPQPNYGADTAHDSQEDNRDCAICDNCEKEFDISVHSTYAGGNGYIRNLPKEWEIDVIEYPEHYYEEWYEAISSNNEFFSTFKKEIENLKELNGIKLYNDSQEKTLKRLLYVGIITSMETYLSDAFIITTLGSKNFIKKFVKTFDTFKEKSIKLSELFEYHDKIEMTCKKIMSGIIYHRLSQVEKMYKSTLEIDLGDIEFFRNAVSIRHSLVHRNGNGKTKDEKDITVDFNTVNQLILNISDFIDGINKRIEEKTSNIRQGENHEQR